MTYGYYWKWAEERDVAELLGTPFGLNLETKDVDHLFYSKFKKKLGYWSTMKLSLTDKAAIYNQVFISTLWFYIIVWGGSDKIFSTIEGDN